MPARGTSVPSSSSKDNVEQDEWRESEPSPGVVEARLRKHFDDLVALARAERTEGTFLDFEQSLVARVFSLGRLLVALFLCCRREIERDVPRHVHREGRLFKRSQAQPKVIASVFGRVRYWRMYMRGSGAGYYPLDEALKLPSDGFSVAIASLMTRVATKVSYAQTCLLLKCMFGWSPSQTSVERAVLGLGRSTSAWFEHAPAPEGDGDVLVIMVDSKATPTATKAELKKRRGKRAGSRSQSPRHRGRERRKAWTPKKRRKKGDHSKNGRSATLVVMYTLRSVVLPDGTRRLEGPVNRKLYASYAPARHAFAIARREANRRGFAPGCGKRIQIVIDGHHVLSAPAKEFFPEAILTLDVIHAIEYLWSAGTAFHREGTDELDAWVRKQKRRLYAGKVNLALRELRQALVTMSKDTSAGRRKRAVIEVALRYLSKRVDMMNYKELMEQDLEISSGPVEGAVRYVINQRFDAAGMRWITERSEPLLQLRCIEINGDWDQFIRFVEGRSSSTPGFDLLAATPGPLPTLGVKAVA